MEAAPASEILAWAISGFGESFAIASSLQKEGMVIVDLASRISSSVRVFTLDTGRLPEETHRMMETVRDRYGISVELVLPDAAEVEQLVNLHGPNLFYQSVELRERCCEARKVRPLARKLRTLKAWATGIRRAQSRLNRALARMHKGFTVWFTGMSGAGKSTISNLLESQLRALGAEVEVLDGDVVRTHLSKGLGFSKEDRDENIRRIGFVCELLERNGVIAITAAISPYREIRDEVRGTHKNFVEVFVSCPLDTLVERDVKGLYKKA